MQSVDLTSITSVEKVMIGKSKGSDHLNEKEVMCGECKKLFFTEEECNNHMSIHDISHDTAAISYYNSPNKSIDSPGDLRTPYRLELSTSRSNPFQD